MSKGIQQLKNSTTTTQDLADISQFERRFQSFTQMMDGALSRVETQPTLAAQEFSAVNANTIIETLDQNTARQKAGIVKYESSLNHAQAIADTIQAALVELGDLVSRTRSMASHPDTEFNT